MPLAPRLLTHRPVPSAPPVPWQAPVQRRRASLPPCSRQRLRRRLARRAVPCAPRRARSARFTPRRLSPRRRAKHRAQRAHISPHPRTNLARGTPAVVEVCACLRRQATSMERGVTSGWSRENRRVRAVGHVHEDDEHVREDGSSNFLSPPSTFCWKRGVETPQEAPSAGPTPRAPRRRLGIEAGDGRLLRDRPLSRCVSTAHVAQPPPSTLLRP